MNFTPNRPDGTAVTGQRLIRSDEWRDTEVCDFSVHGTPGALNLRRRDDPALDGRIAIMSKEFGRLVGDRVVRNALGGDARSTSLALRAYGPPAHTVDESADQNGSITPELAAAMLAAVVAMLDGPNGDPARPEADYSIASQVTPLPFTARLSPKTGPALRTSRVPTALPFAGSNESVPSPRS